jgi:hypothetical protein
MMGTTMNPPHDDSAAGDERDTILIAFADAGPAADLAEWTRRHPEHARFLVRFAASRRFDAATAAFANNPAAAAADERVRNIGRAVLAARRPAPLASLVQAAQARGLSADSLAAVLDLPVACFWKLHRRLFAFDSLPAALIAALAQALARTENEVAAYLRQPPTLARGASYKAASAPVVGSGEDFVRALGDDPDLTEAARARWLEPAE